MKIVVVPLPEFFFGHKMGVHGFLRLVREAAIDRGAQGNMTGPVAKEMDVLAIDANSLVYWAYSSFVNKNLNVDENSKYRTEMSADEIMNEIVARVMAFVKNLVTKLEPKILVIAMDGVPPMAKIIQQKSRRIDIPKDDLLDCNGIVVFSMSWFSPKSILASRLDAAFSTMQFGGTFHTVYSGPGIEGEGEHKIFPILQAICRHGSAAFGEPGRNAPPREGNIPKCRICIFGNDNDFYILSAMFLATFETTAVSVFMYDDHATRKRLQPDTVGMNANPGAKSIYGTYQINDPSDIIVSDVRVFLNAVLDGKYSCGGTDAIEKIVHFTYLVSLLGNDFVPQVTLAAENQFPDIDGLMSIIARASCDTGPFIGNLKKVTGIPIYLKDDRLEFATIQADKVNLYATIYAIAGLLSTESHKISPSFNRQVTQESLLRLNRINGRAGCGNSVAFAAGYTYVHMMDAVISYYISSTFFVPQTVKARFVSTMPDWYYSYGTQLPALEYIMAGCQVIDALRGGELAKHNSLAKCLAEDVMPTIDPSTVQPGLFIAPLVHSALIFPRHSAEIQSSAILPESTLLARAERFAWLFPNGSHPDVNTTLIPGMLLDATIREFNATIPRATESTNYGGVFQLDVLVGTTDGDRQAMASNYTNDSLNI